MMLSSVFRFLRIGRPTRAHWKFVRREWTRLPDVDALAGLLATGRFTRQVAPMVVSCPAARRILVLSPHPDDETIAAGGTLLHVRAKGAAIHIIFLTSGDRVGARGERVGGDVREIEAARVADALDATFECWRFPTHGILSDHATVSRLRAVVSANDPDVILLPFLTDDHEDHRQTALLFSAAFRSHVIRAEAWAYAVYATIPANVVVDVTDVAEEKTALVRAWASEFQHRDWAHYARGRDAVHARWLPGPSARYAEAFFVVPGPEYAAIGAIFLDGDGVERVGV